MRQPSLYILLVENVTLHFSVFRKFLPNSKRSKADIFITNITFCFTYSVKISAKSNKSLKSYK